MLVVKPMKKDWHLKQKLRQERRLKKKNLAMRLTDLMRWRVSKPSVTKQIVNVLKKKKSNKIDVGRLKKRPKRSKRKCS